MEKKPVCVMGEIDSLMHTDKKQQESTVFLSHLVKQRLLFFLFLTVLVKGEFCLI